MASAETPRVTSRYLDAFTSKNVRIVGTVTKLMGTDAHIDSEGQVRILLGPDSHLTMGHAVEVIGKVNHDLSIKAFRTTDFGDRFDMGAHLKLVEASHVVKELFYTPV
ncbi:replication factor A protein 3 [Calycina marina]|uniref:Replication factor A protein 3 n=1 Tax=Calycina marina TaxID=1763456 RepID=A0A9P7Z630_9HELO|nr:replication factor A protein 3 [Calycina marina]